jgi:non-heme chloroperoxidase
VTKRSPSTSWSSANGRTQPAGRRRCLFSVGRDRPSTVPGLLPLPISSLKSRVSCIRQPGQPQPGTPARCFDQFRYAFADAVSEDEGKQLYETYVVPTPGKPLFQAATAN